MNVEERAKEKAGDSWDTLPDNIRTLLIEQERQIAEAQPALERVRELDRAEEVRQQGAVYRQEVLRELGVTDRVGYTEEPSRLKPNRKNEAEIDIASELNELHPVLLCNDHVKGFRRETVDSFVPRMQEIWDRARGHTDVYRSPTAYMMFHLWSGNTQRAGTRAVKIQFNVADYIDELFEALDEFIYDIEKANRGYEFIYSGNNENYIHLYFKSDYYPLPNCISNWGENIKKIEKRDYFDIFTANDPDISCSVQVAKRLFGYKTEINTLEGIINKLSPNVCVVRPHITVSGINYIEDYSDLVIDPASPIKSLNVIHKNAVYLLHYNGHLGILEKLKEQKKYSYKTSFRPLIKFPNCNKITICFDIECYFDPMNNQNHIPYLCCACFIYDVIKSGVTQSLIGNVVDFEGKDCVAQMLDYAADTAKDFDLKKVELIAHNGGGYDFHYLLTSIYDPSIIKNILIRSNHFISFNFNHLNILFNVKDSLNFLLCSLSNAAKAFLDEKDRKTDFPHHEVRTKEDLQKVFNEWISIDSVLDVNIEKEKMLITNRHIINYSKDTNAKRLIDWSKEYCRNDVIVLAKVWNKFKTTVTEVFNCDIVDKTYTLAGMSFRLFEANLPKTLNNSRHHINLKHPNKEDFDNMHKSLIGGRCISVNGVYQDIVSLDVKSLYPAAMAYYEQPYGDYKKVTEEEDYKVQLGIYYCKVKLNKIEGHGFFPIKVNDNVSYNGHSNEYEAWYTSIDMLIGREEGHEITAIPFDGEHVGYSWKQKGKIFEEYIKNVLYKLKHEYEKQGQMEQRWIIKIIMNSLWGKFAQKWMDTNYAIEDESKCDMVKHKCYKIWDTDYMLVKKKKENDSGQKPIQNGIYTLSYARYHMYVLWKKVVKPGTICLYSDTDSMMIPSDSLIENAKFELNGESVPVIGSEMGQLEKEYTFIDFTTVGKKQYIGSYHDKKGNIVYKKRFKGVPQQYIAPKMFSHLIKDKNNEVQVNFLKFKREWGCIQGYVECKTVKQT